MAALHDIGAINKQTMREFDDACLTPVRPISPKQIRDLRQREHVSQSCRKAWPCGSCITQPIPLGDLREPLRLRVKEVRQLAYQRYRPARFLFRCLPRLPVITRRRPELPTGEYQVPVT